MSFQISPELDKNKVFLVRSSELEGRLDPFCYVPELVQLDRKIKSNTRSCLKDFTLFRASGATPKKDAEDYYSDEKNGIPFIRVQNLSVTGELDTRDLVYISKDVHEGMLKRSQIKENDLLVKITGVGRMAVASVVPDGFEGNINQHIVLIRTYSKETSQNLAAFINLDSIEKIASKRATGGTRPALDYAALFSIPVINRREIYETINKAVSLKREKEAEAQRLLDSIDDYLLGELGIELPEQEENTVQSRIFIRRFSEISGGRIDPNFIFLSKILSGKFTDTAFKLVSFGNCIKYIQYGISSLANKEGKGIPVIRMNNLRNYEWDFSDIKHIDLSNDELEKYRLFYGDILFNRTNSKELVGKCGVFKESQHYVFASYLIRVRLDESVLLPDFASSFLGSTLGRLQIDCISRQIIGMTNINAEEIKLIKILVPSLQKQAEIVDHIAQIRSRAKQLQQEATEGLEQAKRAVEAMIFGNA